MGTYKFHHPNRTYSLLKVVLFGVLVWFAIIGVVFSSVFVAMNFGLLNVKGLISDRNDFYETIPQNAIESATLTQKPTQTSCLKENSQGELIPVCIWNQSDEWATIRAGLLKDEATIQKVSQQTGVDARLIAAAVIPEQLRFFTSSRDTYKSYFEPLKILGSLSKFSLGISGIKQETARRIENQTIDTNSPFYTGPTDAKLVGQNSDAEIYNRLTSDDHYYSYLYTALFIKQISAQWQKQGYDLRDRPDVVVTLFNIGFDQSQPKPNPQIGGAAIVLNGETFSFGELGTLFYWSDELNTVL